MSGPFDDHDVFWWGFQVFWWRRFFTLVQVLLATSVLTTLLTQQHKLRVHGWFDEAAREALRVRVPRLVRLRTILAWIIPTILAFSGLFAFVARLPSTDGHTVSRWAVFAALSVVLGLLTIPVASIVLFLSMLFTSFRAAQRYLPPGLAWLFHHQRIDRTIIIVPLLLLFVIVSLLQLYLS